MLLLSLLRINDELLEPLEFVFKINVLSVEVDAQQFSEELDWHHYRILRGSPVRDLQTWQINRTQLRNRWKSTELSSRSRKWVAKVFQNCYVLLILPVQEQGVPWAVALPAPTIQLPRSVGKRRLLKSLFKHLSYGGECIWKLVLVLQPPMKHQLFAVVIVGEDDSSVRQQILQPLSR